MMDQVDINVSRAYCNRRSERDCLEVTLEIDYLDITGGQLADLEKIMKSALTNNNGRLTISTKSSSENPILEPTNTTDLSPAISHPESGSW